MTTKTKDILFVVALLASLAVVFLGIWLGDEYHNAYYALIFIGALAFGGLILGKAASGKKNP